MLYTGPPPRHVFCGPLRSYALPSATWASATAPAGYVYDVQIKRPGTTRFVNCKTGQTGQSSTFVAGRGAGTYSFRARLRKPAVAKQSGYSPVKAISVS